MATSSLIDIPFKRFEIELTSRCNAACPGCRRTHLKQEDKLVVEDITFDTIQDMFDDIDLEGSFVYLCGTLGDPLVHPEFEDIINYLLMKKVKTINTHTNGGMRKPDFWKRISELSKAAKKNDQLFQIQFNVDGGPETNHMYRVNVVWDRVWANMNAYAEGGGEAEWCYIEFDWNTNEIEFAKREAKRMGFDFALRRAWRNKSKEEKGGVPQFGRGERVEENSFDPEALDCKHLNRPELFISCDNKVFPCCYLKDESTKEVTNYSKVEEKYGENFNSLRHHDFIDIINHEWINGGIINTSMVDGHPLFLKRCYVTCGGNGKRLTKIEKLGKQ